MAEPTRPINVSDQGGAQHPQETAENTATVDPLPNLEVTETKWGLELSLLCSSNRTTTPLSQKRNAAANLFSQAYDRDPICHFLIGDMTNDTIRTHLVPYWKAIVRAALMQGATIYEGNRWSTAAIVFPPGKSIDDRSRWRSFALSGFDEVWKVIAKDGKKRLIDNYCAASTQMKETALGDRRGFHIFALATMHHEQSKGLARTFITRLQEMAYREKAPLWIETAVPRTHELLWTTGFVLAAECQVGEGICTANGKFNGGESKPGIKLQGMIWIPTAGPYRLCQLPPEGKTPAAGASGAVLPAVGKPTDQEHDGNPIAESSTAAAASGAKWTEQTMARLGWRPQEEDESTATGYMHVEDLRPLLGGDPYEEGSKSASKSKARQSGAGDVQDSDPLPSGMASQAIMSTSPVEPVAIKGESTEAAKGKAPQCKGGLSRTPSSRPGAGGRKVRFDSIEEEEEEEEEGEEELKLSPDVGKADRWMLFPDKELEQEFWGKGGDGIHESPTRYTRRTGSNESEFIAEERAEDIAIGAGAVQGQTKQGEAGEGEEGSDQGKSPPADDVGEEDIGS
ncbi:hypothetical protein BJY01DRAFT_244699 [Aspergillus pseudoustus]|uniref:N-acetyltransferase domain-containing protein n=1 Tax=Aspergillus pseudoustus TaxID=1810923 RepID=A0ABR4KIL8_9EURO